VLYCVLETKHSNTEGGRGGGGKLNCNSICDKSSKPAKLIVLWHANAFVVGL
jgi:hypothetical protein